MQYPDVVARRSRQLRPAFGPIERVAAGARDPADYELMLDISLYMTHYSDTLHHPKEDIVFARIKSRDASASATIEELTTQHATAQWAKR
jgi:hemerythrin-like domain-containing protein